MPALSSDYVLLQQSDTYSYRTPERREHSYCLEGRSLCDYFKKDTYHGLGKGGLHDSENCPTDYRHSIGIFERPHSGLTRNSHQLYVDRTLRGFSDKGSLASLDSTPKKPVEKNVIEVYKWIDNDQYIVPEEHDSSYIAHSLDRISLEKKVASHTQLDVSRIPRQPNRICFSEQKMERYGAPSSSPISFDGSVVPGLFLNRQPSNDIVHSGEGNLATSPTFSVNFSDSTLDNQLESFKETLNDDENSRSLARQTGQSYNMQSALATRLMAEAELVSETRLFGYDGQDAAHRSVEATAHRFWANGSLGYTDLIQNGFYVIWGMNPGVWNICNLPAEKNKMPSLDMLRAVGPSESSLEVVLVDKSTDPLLQYLETTMIAAAQEPVNQQLLAERLGQRVCVHFGGPASAENIDLRKRWRLSSSQLKHGIGSVVLPLGKLTVGLCRHRALLFKILADSVKLPCRIVRGCKYCRSDDGASCIVLCDPNSEYYVDLIGMPGMLSPPDQLWSSTSMSFRSRLRFAQSNSSYDDVKALSESFRPECHLSSSPFSTGSGTEEPAEEKKEIVEVALEAGAQWFTSGPHHMNLLNNTPGEEVWAVMNISQERALTVFRDELQNARSVDRRLAKTLASGHLSFIAEVKDDTRAPVKISNVSAGRCGLAFHNDEKSFEVEAAYLVTEDNRQDRRSSQGIKVDEKGKWVEAEPNVETWNISWEDITVKDKIGGGSFGMVYRGKWRGTDVAVKILIEQDINEGRLKVFQREIGIMQRLRHPNVVLFMGAISKRPNLCLVTEYLPRGSLFRLLHKSRSRELLDERRRLGMAYDVALGMNYLHRRNPPIVHRDLKTANLLVDKTWTIKVCDFGLSRFKPTTFLSTRSCAGTPENMAPEVMRNEQCTEKSDVYSYGVVLWELVTMRHPWSGMSPAQVVGAVCFQSRRPLIPEDVNPCIAQLIEKCWSNDPRQRPSFGEIMVTLKDILKVKHPQPPNGGVSRAKKGE